MRGQATAPHLGSLFDLGDKNALVTGAASGLGRAIAIGLDAFGARVAMLDIDADGLEEVRSRLRNPTLMLVSDVRDSSAPPQATETILGEWGKLDIAFNMPGINVRLPALEIGASDWHRVLELNLTALFFWVQEQGRVMLRQGHGVIVNMASARGVVGGRSQSAYSASKAAVISLTRCLALEWAPTVRVNALAPGYFMTPLVSSAAQDKRWYERMKRLHALGRFADPQEIVGSAVFLASDASSFVTGAVLSVDGGWTAGWDPTD